MSFNLASSRHAHDSSIGTMTGRCPALLPGNWPYICVINLALEMIAVGTVVAISKRVERKSTKNWENYLPPPEVSPGKRGGVGGRGREGEGERGERNLVKFAGTSLLQDPGHRRKFPNSVWWLEQLRKWAREGGGGIDEFRSLRETGDIY